MSSQEIPSSHSENHSSPQTPRILVADVGGTFVKLYLGSETIWKQFASGAEMTPERFIDALKPLIQSEKIDGISIGFPAPIHNNRITKAPVNLGKGWVDFDFSAALPYEVRLINDAAMQALGSYCGGTMLFLGLGTGLGSSLVIDNHLLPLEIAHLPFKEQTYEYYISSHRRDRIDHAVWQKDVMDIIELFNNAFMPDYVVLGGGNVHNLDQLPPYVKRGDNDKAYLGGLRLWDNAKTH